MTKITFHDGCYEIEKGETVLDCLLRHGCEIPFSCKAGACQSCMMRASEGKVEENAQLGLKTTFKKQNYFLSCQCKPEIDLSVSLPGLEETTLLASIKNIVPLCHNVKAILLTTNEPFDCLPGQYLSLINKQGCIRSYSVANDPKKDGHIELHVRLIANGTMSSWLHHDATQGDHVQIRGPAGTCCYVGDEQKTKPLLLAGTGTGLAPLYGVLNEAITQQHQGDICLVQGALHAKDLYYVEKLKQLSAQVPHFTYIPSTLHDDGVKDVIVGDIQDLLLDSLSNPTESHVYLCGSPDFVNLAKKKVFLKGVASKHIFSDAFIPTSN